MTEITFDGIARLRKELWRLQQEELLLYQESIDAYGTPEYDARIDEFYACGRKVRAAERRVRLAQSAADEG
jgi:hypothetical protein